MKKQMLLALLGSIILAGCQSGFTDMSRELSVREVYHLPSGGFLDIAWLDSQTIIMNIDEGNNSKFEVLDINSRESRSIHLESTCKRPFTRSLKILPNQRAGFILDCIKPKSQIIQEIDLVNNITKDIHIEPSIGWVANFSYSHDMTEMVLVDNRGLYLESSLIFVDSKGERTNITPDFQRADFPSWSPTDDVVAFLGTKPYSGSDDPQSWNQIANLLDFPWRLYLFYPSNNQIVEFPLEILHPGRFKWSPDGKIFAFAGEYKGFSGVWIVSNLDTPDKLTATRIVDGFAVFDFSPDSKSLVHFGINKCLVKRPELCLDKST